MKGSHSVYSSRPHRCRSLWRWRSLGLSNLATLTGGATLERVVGKGLSVEVVGHLTLTVKEQG